MFMKISVVTICPDFYVQNRKKSTIFCMKQTNKKTFLIAKIEGNGILQLSQ